MDEQNMRAEKLAALEQMKAAERRPLLRRQNALGQALDALDETMDRLHSQLSPVLAPEQPTPALATLRGEDEGSELAAFLQHMTARAESMQQRLESLTGRVDL